MEALSRTRKRGRYDCPACGKPLRNLVRRGTSFRPQTFCPSCGSRISIYDLYDYLPLFGLSIMFFAQAMYGVFFGYAPGWVKLLFRVLWIGLLVMSSFNLARLLIKGPYRVISDKTTAAAKPV